MADVLTLCPLPVLQSIWPSSPRWLPSMTRSSATIWMRLASSQMYVSHIHSPRQVYRTILTLHIVFRCMFILSFGFKNSMNIELLDSFLFPIVARVASSPWSSGGDIYLPGGLNDCPLPGSAYFFCFPHFFVWLHGSAQWMTRLKSLWGVSRRSDE